MRLQYVANLSDTKQIQGLLLNLYECRVRWQCFIKQYLQRNFDKRSAFQRHLTHLNRFKIDRVICVFVPAIPLLHGYGRLVQQMNLRRSLHYRLFLGDRQRQLYLYCKCFFPITNKYIIHISIYLYIFYINILNYVYK